MSASCQGRDDRSLAYHPHVKDAIAGHDWFAKASRARTDSRAFSGQESNRSGRGRCPPRSIVATERGAGVVRADQWARSPRAGRSPASCRISRNIGSCRRGVPGDLTVKVLPSDGSLVRAALVSYFDIGVSFGLGDGVFDPALVEDTGIVGLVNPLGRGRHVDLLADAPAVVAKWRAAAAAEIRPEALVAWAGTAGSPTVRAKLTRYVTEHPIERCYLRIYSVGTVYLHLQFAVGVAEECVRGLLGSFENAAYTAGVSNALLDVAADQARQAVARNRRGLAGLARRAPARVQRDANGYEESDLIPSFTKVLLCVDEPDAARTSELAATWQLDPSDVVEYEHHGRLHLDGPPAWSSRVTTPAPCLPDNVRHRRSRSCGFFVGSRSPTSFWAPARHLPGCSSMRCTNRSRVT